MEDQEHKLTHEEHKLINMYILSSTLNQNPYDFIYLILIMDFTELISLFNPLLVAVL